MLLLCCYLSDMFDYHEGLVNGPCLWKPSLKLIWCISWRNQLFISVQAQGMLSLPTPPPRSKVLCFGVQKTWALSAKNQSQTSTLFHWPKKNTKHGHEIWRETPQKKHMFQGNPSKSFKITIDSSINFDSPPQKNTHQVPCTKLPYCIDLRVPCTLPETNSSP